MKTPVLDRQITIQSRSSIRGADGAVQWSWSNLVTLPAARRDVIASGRDEIAVGGVVTDLLVTNFTTRWTPTVAALDGSQRILHDGRVFTIEGQPQEVGGRRRFLQFTATSGRAKT